MAKVTNKDARVKRSRARREKKLRNFRRRRDGIGSVESCERELSSRSGLCCYMEYLDPQGLLGFISEHFEHHRKSKKGLSLGSLVTQLLGFFADGTNTALSFFDVLKDDSSRFSLLGIEQGSAASSHTMKRFLKKFQLGDMRLFESIYLELFAWRLKVEQPKVLELCLDSVVYNNDDALKRHGCSPTYKKVKGFQPLNVLWNGYTAWSRFRSGSTHGNHGTAAATAIKQVTQKARSVLPNVQIIWRLDSGFFDQELFQLCNDLNTICIITGKMYNDVKEAVGNVAESAWRHLKKKNAHWRFAEISYMPKSWKPRIARTTTIYTSLVSNEHGQGVFSFERPDQVIVSNYDPANSSHRQCIGDIEQIVRLNHSRGADELVHRATKEMSGEKFPFKKFFANAAYYHFMVLAYNTFIAFQRDVVAPVIPELLRATPNTLRRRIIDIAGRIVRTARRTVLKVFAPKGATAELHRVWRFVVKLEPTFVT